MLYTFFGRLFTNLDDYIQLFGSVELVRGGSRRKEISKKSTLNYKEVYDELVNQNEIPIKMTATKEDLNILEANFDGKINKLSNILFEKLQNVIDT